MIEVVGIGLDGIEGLTTRVKPIVAQAEILVGSDRHLSYFPHHRAQRLVLGDLQQIIATIRHYWEENPEQSIVVLTSGDPLFFGLGRLLLSQLPVESLRFHPHFCSVQLAFNRLKIPWQDARIISVHGRELEELIPLLQQGVEKIALLTDEKNNPRAIANLYLSLDLPNYYTCWVCENLGDSQEKITYFADLKDVLALDFATLNVVVLLRQSRTKQLDLDNLPLLGLPDETFYSFSDRPGLMTKREIRLMVLGELALQQGQVIWDIGAGTGSVAVEIARLCSKSRVYAVEKKAMGISLIEQNSQLLGVSNVIPIYGNAPTVLSNLPKPDRVFIGGSGGQLSDILSVCEQRLTKDGKVVLALATLEHLSNCLQWLGDRSWHYHLLQMQISRSVSISQLTRFSPLNPVTIITAFP
jgi:precorrin-6Y C5,15-methyltransferase (decarboxylating)